jgi:amidase
MRKFLSKSFLSSSLLLLAGVVSAQDATKQAHPPDSAIAGRWIVSTDFYGSPLYFMMELEQNGEKLRGNFDGEKLEGTITGNSVQVLAKDDQGGTEDAEGTAAERHDHGNSCLREQR